MQKYIPFLLIATMTLNIPKNLYAETNNKDVISMLKLEGSFRLRYQTEKKESLFNRERNRIKFKLGGESDISEQSKVKFGFATGDTDPRSRNQTFQDSFSPSIIRLDYAYIEHALSNQIMLFGGKMKNPLWEPSEFLWDTDITPDGYGVRFDNKINSTLKWSITAGYFILDELNSNKKNPYLLAIQPGMDWAFNEKTKARIAAGFYLSKNLKGLTLEHSSRTNTVGSSGLEKDFSSIVMSGEIDFKDQLGLPLVRPFGEVVINTRTNQNNKGGIVGVKFGDQAVHTMGQWQSNLSYRYLGADAWLDTLPDSDCYGGATDVQGFELIFNYALSKTTTLGIDLYSMYKINGSRDKQTLAQFDLNIKF